MNNYVESLEAHNTTLSNKITELNNLLDKYKIIELIFNVTVKGVAFKGLTMQLSFKYIPSSLKICDLKASNKLKNLHILKINGDTEERHMMLEQFKKPEYYIDAVMKYLQIDGIPYKVITNHV